MSRALLLHRAVALHRPQQQLKLSLRPFSTTKGDKEKRRTKNFDSPGSPLDRTARGNNKKKRERPNKKGEGPPILIPPGRKQSFASLPHPPFDRSHTHINEESFVHDLWTVNVSPFLDSEDYCKRSAFYETSPTRDGTLAMRRLLQGKERMLETLRNDIVQSSRSKRRNKPRSYAIIGHGVPKQLLQANVDLADNLLKSQKYAAEVSFKSLTSKLDFDTIRVRQQGPDRESRLEPFPSDDNNKWHHPMQLYLTVMNRIAEKLSHVLWHGAPVPPMDNEEDEDFVLSADASTTTLHHWKVDFLRGGSENPSDSFLTPIVEWTLPEKHTDSGRISIRLRGQPSRAQKPTLHRRRKKAPLEVTLIFHATFENPFKEL